MKQIILTILILIILPIRGFSSELSCIQLKEKVAKRMTRIKKLKSLKEKNLVKYEEYKHDISKKIKITSNLFILTNKIEQVSLQISDIENNITKMKCLVNNT
ncbi:MAG: hypothetical protein HOJ35_01745 [Bdellovibrionales bacterium]|nr:hypothetical protein [Bdellovibrionales bacterium]